MPAPATATSANLAAWICLLLAGFLYFFALGSDHAATNGDELLYAQITRLTAATGDWLPLQSQVERHRNTKPPALFWQGIVSTGWGKQWDLWHLRYPNVIYTLGIAAMVFFLGRKLGGGTATGVLAALVYLCFFGTYRYGRVFLTSAPETFWLFLPFCLLLLRPNRDRGIGWIAAFLFGILFGFALLYKSFALAVPAAAGLAWWTMHGRGYRFVEWLKRDAFQIALAGIVSLAVFCLWYWLDPQRHLILSDFVLDENVGKFNTDGENYFANLLWGDSSIWRNVVSYPINAGLLAPAVIAVIILALRRRREMQSEEKLLWFWMITMFVVFSLPNQRDERYLLPGMPALAVLCALYWMRIPVWLLEVSLLAVAVIALGLGWGGTILTKEVGEGALFPWYFWFVVATTIVFSLAALARSSAARTTILPAILLLYLAFGLFLTPFDGPRGLYDAESREFAYGRRVAVPINFGAREEVYRFLLPGCDVQPYKLKNGADPEKLRAEYRAFVVSLPLSDDSIEKHPALRVVGTRLNIIDRFNNEETMDMLRGNVSRQLFKKDILVEADPGTP